MKNSYIRKKIQKLFQNFDFNISCKNENENKLFFIIQKNYAADPAIQFPKNRFYDLWSSQRPSASMK